MYEHLDRVHLLNVAEKLRNIRFLELRVIIGLVRIYIGIIFQEENVVMYIET